MTEDNTHSITLNRDELEYILRKHFAMDEEAEVHFYLDKDASEHEVCHIESARLVKTDTRDADIIRALGE